MRFIRLSLLAIILIFTVIPGIAHAQTYQFSIDRLNADVYWNEDGTVTILYTFVFINDPSASPIDYVDVGLPNSDFDARNISASVSGMPITNISRGGYEGKGFGVALGLGSNAIRPGASGEVQVQAERVRNVLYPDSTDSQYASAVFSPTYFGSQFVKGQTDITVTFHLPTGVKPEEPRWHKAPSGWPSEPETGIDEQGRMIYTWKNPQAFGYKGYKFGASFPVAYIPAETIVQKSSSWGSGIPIDYIITAFIVAIFIILIVAYYRRDAKRKLQYLPPKISIEGHGIKRGLTAVEAAILLEQPLDKILTLILFSIIKKGAASVETIDPFKLDVTDPVPEGLYDYEINFLEAFQDKPYLRRTTIKDAMVNLVNSVSRKMKGFSHNETVVYYRDIVKRAWAQVEAADIPEVKSQKYDENMEWTMLDRDYDERTRRAFHTGPVFVPNWWGQYDPTFRPGASSGASKTTRSAPSKSGDVSMPTLPGSDFAASVVTGVQDFSSSVVGNVTDFTSKITSETNPVPVSTSSGGGWGGGGGGGCACACACAGCACACAGGGR